MAGKRKKRGKPKSATDNPDAAAEVHDELLALEAIFGQDLELQEDGQGFALEVVPHPGEAKTNYVRVTLIVSLPRGYPSEELGLKLVDAEGLAEVQVRALSKRLHQAAAEYAAAGEICCFQLVTLAQDFLQEHNVPPDEEEPEPAGPESLWHEMQLREAEAGAEVMEQSIRAGGYLASTFDAFDGGLFSEAAEPAWAASPATPPVPAAPLQVAAAAGAAAAKTGLPPLSRSGSGKPSKPPPHQQPQMDAKPEATAAQLPGSAAAPSSAAPGPFADSEAETSEAEEASRSQALQAERSTGSMLTAVKRAASAVLPKPLRRYLDVPGSDAASEAGGESTLSLLDTETDREQIRREMLLGHLLLLACRGGAGAALPPHALPAVAEMLQAQGLLPKWLAWTLTQQQPLFDRAFRRLFAQELLKAGAADEPSPSPFAARPAPAEGGEDGEAGWALERFWQRRPALVAAHSSGHLRSRAAGVSEALLPASRYEADFTELKQLGRGGFGVVCAAINRFDMRQYAIKKIPLDAPSPAAYPRLMREVQTLSKLQHPAIVRYYQAWVEAAPMGRGGEGETDEEEEEESLGEWGGPSPSNTHTGTFSITPPGSRRAGLPGVAGAAAKAGGLATVAEASREGRASTPSDARRQEEEEGSSSAISASFGNLAVAGGKRLLSHSSQTHTGSEDDGDTRGTLTAGSGTVSGLATSTSDSGGFTFDRSHAVPSANGTQDFESAAQTGPSSSQAMSQQRQQRPSSRQSRRSSGRGSPRMRQMLYIQMEFCPRTLRAVLDMGPMEEADRWRILKQILSGLAHIHAQGIIHRDLKPANIFFSPTGDVKLGDFGLAKFNTTPDGLEASSPGGSGPAGGGTVGLGQGADTSEASGVLGTSFYISPEIADGWARYDEKVDMFSLGVVAFELWHPFSTAMERAVLLRDLRERGAMPAEFEAAQPVVCRLIRWLLAPNPGERPSAKEVLRCDLLPPTVGDEQLADLLRSLPENPLVYERVVDAIFSMTSGAGAAAQLDDAPGTPAPVQMAARDHVVGVVNDCFARRGSVGMCSLDIWYASAEEPKGAMQLLAPSGTKLALRYELRQPFVHWALGQIAGGGAGAALLDGLRRHEVACVQRRAPGQGLPRSHLQADLDLIQPGGGSTAEQLLAEAEVISAVADVLEELPECGQAELRLGHSGLLELALRFVGVAKELRASVVQLLATASAASPLHAQARSKRWPSIRAGLEGLGVSADAIGRCRQLLLQVAGEPEAALFRLRALLAGSASAQASSSTARRLGSSASPLACLDELAALLPYLEAWGLGQGSSSPIHLVIDPLVTPQADYYSGVLFQLHLVQPSSGMASVVALGGRYDALLKSTWARLSALSGMAAPMPPLQAVGATLNLERLVAVAAASARWRPTAGGPGLPGLGRLSQADVLVCSRGGGGMLKERMALVRALWEADVAAEMLAQAAPSLTEQYEYAHARGIPWLVIISGASFAAADTVRVKSLNSRVEEAEVPTAEVPAYILAAMQPHGAGGAASAAAGSRTPLYGRSLTGGGGGEDVEGEGAEEGSAHGAHQYRGGWRRRDRR